MREKDVARYCFIARHLLSLDTLMATVEVQKEAEGGDKG